MQATNEQRNIQNILNVISKTGAVLLESGAEIFRVQDTLRRMLYSIPGVSKANVYVVPSSITVSFFFRNEPYTYLFVVKGADIDLNRVSLINDFSRRFVDDDNTDYESAIKELDSISTVKVYRRYPKYFIIANACGIFSFMFSGGVKEYFISTIIGFILINFIRTLQRSNISFFIINVVGAIIAGSLAILASKLLSGLNVDSVIIGSIMLLVPGIAITNSARDIMSGDFVSGSTRLLEVIFSALAIALGVIISFYFLKGI